MQAKAISALEGITLWNPSIAAYSAPKLMWLRENHPEAYAATRHVLFSKDYLRLRMTGELSADFSDVSGSLVWDFGAREWDTALLSQLGIAVSLLPQPQESTAIAGYLTEQAAAGEEVSREAERLAQLVVGVSKAMREQAAAGDQITQAVDSMRRQADQTTKAMAEQVRAARDMTVSSQNVSKQIGLMTRANREHASQAQNVISALAEIRTVTESNARGVRETQRAAASLLERAKGLNTIMDRLA